MQFSDHQGYGTVIFWFPASRQCGGCGHFTSRGHATSRNFAAMFSNQQHLSSRSQGGKSTIMNHFAATWRKLDMFPVLVCFIAISLATACHCGAVADTPSIDVNDFFQLPADMVAHFPLIHNIEHTQQSTAFAHISKEADSWTAHSARRSVTIPTTSTNLSFFYHNHETGTITKVQNTYETVADTVYLEHIPSVLHVVCDSNTSLTLTFNTSYPFSSRGLKFGLKRGHYLKFTKVSGGHSFFCNSSCIMGNVIARNVLDVVSYSEDAATGLLTSITLETSSAPQEAMYQTVADYFINGTFALIPKVLLRTQANSSRLNWHAYLKKVHYMKEDFKVRSAAKLRAATCAEGDVLCYEIGSSGIEVRYKKTIDLFNFNFESDKGKAYKPFIQLFGSGSSSTTETMPTGIVFGCDNCYAYAGVSFTFKVAFSASTSGLQINYFQLQVSGKLVGNFNLVAIIPSPSSGTRLMYQTSDGNVKTVDGKAALTSKLASFTNEANFNPSNAVTPDFPADAKTLFSLSLGSITLKAYMALAVEVGVTGSNVFTAQAGAFASATMSVGLFLFQKVTDTCTTNKVYSASECSSVVAAAGTTTAAIASCTPPTTTSTTSGKCITSKYLVIQVVDGPTVKSGLNGPSLTAAKKEDLTVTVAIYPVAKITAYDGIFALYVSPKLEALVTAKKEQASCTEGVQIQVPVFKISQVYAWSDIVIDIAKWIPLCTLDACKFSMGMQAPLLLSSPISIPLPAIVTSMFPLCAAVAGATPLVGRLVATAGAASSLTLGSSVSVESGTTTNTFTATISALSDAFPADSEVTASSGLSATIQGSSVKTTLSISAKSSSGSELTSTDSGKVFTFKVDFSGKSSISANSVAAPENHLTVSSAPFQQKTASVRSELILMFCPKPLASCAAADWTERPCDGTCSRSGSTVTETGATKFGSYALAPAGAGGSSGGTAGSASGFIGDTSYAASIVIVIVILVVCIGCIAGLGYFYVRKRKLANVSAAAPSNAPNQPLPASHLKQIVINPPPSVAQALPGQIQYNDQPTKSAAP